MTSHVCATRPINRGNPLGLHRNVIRDETPHTPLQRSFKERLQPTDRTAAVEESHALEFHPEVPCNQERITPQRMLSVLCGQLIRSLYSFTSTAEQTTYFYIRTSW